MAVSGTVFLLGVILSLDAAAVAAVRGMTSGRGRLSDGLMTGAAFGFLQAGMPLFGYFCGSILAKNVLDAGGNVLSGVILLLLGLRMLLDQEKQKPRAAEGYAARLLSQAVATSIDALAVGVGLGGLCESVPRACALIGAVTFVICLAGYFAGSVLSDRLGSQKARMLGGAALMLLAVRTLFF